MREPVCHDSCASILLLALSGQDLILDSHSDWPTRGAGHYHDADYGVTPTRQKASHLPVAS